MGKHPLFPLGWPDRISDCSGNEECNTVYRRILSCLGPEGLEQLRRYNLKYEVAARCGTALSELIDSTSDLKDLALHFAIVMYYIEDKLALAEPTDVVSATRRLINAVKVLFMYVDKSYEARDTKTAEFILNLLDVVIYGFIRQYVEDKGYLSVRRKAAELARRLTSLVGTTEIESTTTESTPDWW